MSLQTKKWLSKGKLLIFYVLKSQAKFLSFVWQFYHVTWLCIYSFRILDLGKDYYKILDVPEDVSDESLKRAFHKFALKIHPDKNRADGATEAFKILNTAYEVNIVAMLSNTRKEVQPGDLRRSSKTFGLRSHVFNQNS